MAWAHWEMGDIMERYTNRYLSKKLTIKNVLKMVICYKQYGVKLNIDVNYWLVLYLLKFATEKNVYFCNLRFVYTELC